MTPSRRAVLLGGAALLAPLVLGSRRARADATPPRRLLVFFVPNGMKPSLWTPTGTGVGWTPSPVLTALEPVREEVLVLTGLANEASCCGHASDPVLRALPLRDASDAPSLDQRIATSLGDVTPLRSLNLASERESPCPDGDCASRSRLSWIRGGVPAERDTSTSAVYRRLFGGAGASGLVLDAVRADLARYVARAGTDDRRRLDAFADGLADVERRASAAACAAPQAPVDPGALYGDDDHVRTMLDLAVLALQCDRTRIVTYMLGNAASDRPLDFLGIRAGHHELSHTSRWDDQAAVGRWAVGHFVRLVQRLADTPDVDGSRLLDHTWVVFTSEMGDPGPHLATDLPILLAGGPGGPTRGQHLAFPGRPLADLWLALLRGFGVGDPTFGRDGTSPLIQLG